MKKIAVFALLLSMLASMLVYARTDDFIFLDPINDIYSGTSDASQQILYFNYTDLLDTPGGNDARDAIVRSSALGAFIPGGARFNPGSNLDRQEAIAIIIRTIGLEADALAAGTALINTLSENSPLRDVWSVGYLTVARNIGLINQQQYLDAVAPEQAGPLAANRFSRSASVMREEFADWLYRALLYVNQDAFEEPTALRFIYSYTDWENTAADKVEAVEQLIRHRIMIGDGSGMYRPKGNLTRLEAARAIRNLEFIHYDLFGIEAKSGTVAGFSDVQLTEAVYA
ncbi:MAG: S-layer homology domain-containing protein, partial [Defluviitaleaceae bacterium]|nr:S-layer homology domain-containing protein [Defluviitaleaceae bacterium]